MLPYFGWGETITWIFSTFSKLYSTISRHLFIVLPLLSLFFCPHARLPTPYYILDVCVFSKKLCQNICDILVWVSTGKSKRRSKQPQFILSVFYFLCCISRQLQKLLRASDSINNLCSGDLLCKAWNLRASHLFCYLSLGSGDGCSRVKKGRQLPAWRTQLIWTHGFCTAGSSRDPC